MSWYEHVITKWTHWEHVHHATKRALHQRHTILGLHWQTSSQVWFMADTFGFGPRISVPDTARKAGIVDTGWCRGLCQGEVGKGTAFVLWPLPSGRTFRGTHQAECPLAWDWHSGQFAFFQKHLKGTPWRQSDARTDFLDTMKIHAGLDCLNGSRSVAVWLIGASAWKQVLRW